MTPGLKAKWIKALRSGKYKQGRNRLHYDDKYCCLGVLCDITGYEWRTITCNIKNVYCCDAGEKCLLRPEESFGLPQDIHDTCALMNDSEKSFEEIADYIEKNL